MCLEEGKLPELAFDWFVFACVHQTASRHQAMRADETDISWLNMLAKPQPPCISKLPWRQCVPAKKAPRSSRSGDRTLSDFQPLHPNSVKYRGDYNQTQAFYGHWLNRLLMQHTHTGQVRSRAVCFPAAVVLRVPAAGCFCTVRFVLRGWGAFRGATSFLSACFSAH